MGEQYLIDSNAAIDYLGGKLPASGISFMNKVVNDIYKISIITKIEMLGYNAPEKDEHILIDFIESSLVLDLSDEVVTKTITLRKKHKIKIPDAIIAATAICFKLTLISRNETDFKNIPQLKIINPFSL